MRLSAVFLIVFCLFPSLAKATGTAMGYPSGGYALTVCQPSDSNPKCTTSSSGVSGPWTLTGPDIYNNNTGNIGIGTSTPQGGLVVMNGNVGIGTWVPSAPLTVKDNNSTGIAIVQQWLDVANNPIAYINKYGAINLNIGGNSVTGLTVSGGIASSNGNATFISGNVGIGTTIPQDGLIVMNGNVGIGTWVPQSQTVIMGGNVGIGINPPTKLLEIKGAIGKMGLTSSTGTNASYTTYNNTGAGTFYVGIDNSSGNDIQNGTALPYAGAVWTSSTTPLILGTNSTARIIMPATGNVGIGSTLPGQALDVNGTVRTNGLYAVGANIGVTGSGATSCLCKAYTGGICTTIGTCT